MARITCSASLRIASLFGLVWAMSSFAYAADSEETKGGATPLATLPLQPFDPVLQGTSLENETAAVPISNVTEDRPITEETGMLSEAPVTRKKNVRERVKKNRGSLGCVVGAGVTASLCALICPFLHTCPEEVTAVQEPECLLPWRNDTGVWGVLQKGFISRFLLATEGLWRDSQTGVLYNRTATHVFEPLLPTLPEDSPVNSTDGETGMEPFNSPHDALQPLEMCAADILETMNLENFFEASSFCVQQEDVRFGENMDSFSLSEAEAGLPHLSAITLRGETLTCQSTGGLTLFAQPASQYNLAPCSVRMPLLRYGLFEVGCDEESRELVARVCRIDQTTWGAVDENKDYRRPVVVKNKYWSSFRDADDVVWICRTGRLTAKVQGEDACQLAQSAQPACMPGRQECKDLVPTCEQNRMVWNRLP